MAEDMNLGWIDFSKTDGQTLLKTIYKEADGVSEEVQEEVWIAIAWVILNRAGGNWKGETNIREIIRGNPQLFKCWDKGVGDGTPKDDKDVGDVPENAQKDIGIVLTAALGEKRGSPSPVDPTKGATYYCNNGGNPIILDPKFKQTLVIDNFQFYRDLQ